MEVRSSLFHGTASISSRDVSLPGKVRPLNANDQGDGHSFSIQYSSGDYAWIMASAALVFMMIPGIALFYSGLRSQKTALSIIWLNMMVSSVVTIQVSFA